LFKDQPEIRYDQSHAAAITFVSLNTMIMVVDSENA